MTDTFVREVDENLRRDRLRDFARAYGIWVIAGVVLFLAAAGGWLYWQQHELDTSAKQVDQLAATFKDIGAGNIAGPAKQLDTLSSSRSEAVRASALFTRAAIAIEQNDMKTATAKFRQIASDDSLPKPYRDLALIRQTALEFDRLPPDQVIARLQPLTKPGDPWFGSAGEMTAMALIKQGKKAEAGRLFLTIAKDTSAPDAIRARAVQIAGTLGVDASGAMPEAQ
jgi:hypothetical protein